MELTLGQAGKEEVGRIAVEGPGAAQDIASEPLDALAFVGVGIAFGGRHLLP
jgi:hypothetical protein